MGTDEEIPSNIVPAACEFFRHIIGDPFFTEHDLQVAMDHARECQSCAKAMGRSINEQIKRNKQAKASES